MANPTYTLIQSVTLTTATATVTLGSGGTIPQTYNDLKLLFSARTNSGLSYENVIVQPNGSTSNLSDKTLFTVNGTSASSAGDPTQLIIGQAATSIQTASVFGNSEAYFSNYTLANNKSISSDGVNENNAAAATLMMIAGFWSNTAAITSLVIAPSIGTTFNAYSSFYLYGINNS